MIKHFFFDLDDTLTASRSPMAPEHVPLFERLCAQRDVIIVSGAQESQIRKQVQPGRYFILSQSGNHAVSPDGTLLWKESFTDAQKEAIAAFIREVHDDIRLPVSDENNLVEDRGSQISYSLIGHDENRDKKKAFDPDGSKRRRILADHSATMQKLADAGVEITIGGTTCLDIFLAGKNKGFHVPRLINLMGWSKDDAVYVGDALEPGRNDESVIGVIATKSVTGPDDTFSFIKEMLS